jgi:uncharacterized protein GlcG (DUF336 family)
MDPRLSFAMATLERALGAARRYGLEASIAVVDTGGHLIAAARRDLTSHASFEAARKKAYTAAALRLPTSALAEMIASDAISQRALAANADLLAVPGGFPLIQEGVCIGGIGVAGGAWPDDQLIAAEAVEVVGAS